MYQIHILHDLQSFSYIFIDLFDKLKQSSTFIHIRISF